MRLRLALGHRRRKDKVKICSARKSHFVIFGRIEELIPRATSVALRRHFDAGAIRRIGNGRRRRHTRRADFRGHVTHKHIGSVVGQVVRHVVGGHVAERDGRGAVIVLELFGVGHGKAQFAGGLRVLDAAGETSRNGRHVRLDQSDGHNASRFPTDGVGRSARGGVGARRSRRRDRASIILEARPVRSLPRGQHRLVMSQILGENRFRSALHKRQFSLVLVALGDGVGFRFVAIVEGATIGVLGVNRARPFICGIKIKLIVFHAYDAIIKKCYKTLLTTGLVFPADELRLWPRDRDVPEAALGVVVGAVFGHLLVVDKHAFVIHSRISRSVSRHGASQGVVVIVNGEQRAGSENATHHAVGRVHDGLELVLCFEDGELETDLLAALLGRVKAVCKRGGVLIRVTRRVRDVEADVGADLHRGKAIEGRRRVHGQGQGRDHQRRRRQHGD